jgi:hypothetical protein
MAELTTEIAEALAAYHQGDPDSVPSVKIRSAWRDLSCSGSGPEAYRRVRYPGFSDEVWPDADRLPATGIRAAERRASVHCEVPIGTLVVEFSRDVRRNRRGRCSVNIGLVHANQDSPGAGKIAWCAHRTLRARPVYSVTLPDGTVVEIARREL